MAIIHGKFIRPRAYSKPGTYIRSPENIVTDEGLSGYGGITHVMNTNCEAMWLSEREANEIYVAFDFGSCMRLGFMYVWNFNQSDGFGSGLKKARIEYSLDGETWNLFSDVIFAQATGKDNLRATNLNDGKNSPVDFNGLSARYIRILPDTKTGEGCWGKYVEAQIRYGLSKVRFFLYRGGPEKGSEAYALGLNISHNILTSQAGLLEDKLGNDAKTMWISESYPVNTDMVFDLNMSAFIRGFEYINYNTPGFLNAGVKNISVFTSLDAISWRHTGDFCLKRAKGSQNESFEKITFASPEYARYIKLVVKGGAGDGTFGYCNGFEFRYGLGKLRFLYAKKGYFTEPARDFTALLSNYSGWNGADGLFSAGLDGNEHKRTPQEAAGYRSIFLFSDSFLGDINPLTGARRRGDLVNNSLAYLTGLDPQILTLDFEYGKDGRKTHDNILKNDNPFTYWMQDCAVIKNTLYVFTDNVVSENENRELPEGFRFRLIGVDMLLFDIKNGKLDYSSQKSIKTPLFATKPKSLMFGCGVFVNTAEAGMPNPDGYAYVYGYIDIAPGSRNLLCSRVKPEKFADFDSYEFFDGKDWSKDMFASAPIAVDVSPEMSVMPDDNGKYAYVYSPMGVGTTISLCTGDTPYGPFDNPLPLFDMGRLEDTDVSRVKKVYCYNAKAHYHLAQKNEMLISYNVNTMDYESHFINGNIYRPRFLRYRRY
jgi:hypothetical protein